MDISSLIQCYRTYLLLEKTLSHNSVNAYMSDLVKLLKYLESIGKNPLDVELRDLQKMFMILCQMGIHPRSQVRIISGIRSFYYFLELEKHITNNPTECLVFPKLGKKLPEFLTVDEINSIIATIDLSQPEGQRNKAIIETLYSCGLRVSELIKLSFSNFSSDEDFLKINGKGNKQRIVPIANSASKEIRLYLIDRQRIPVKKGFEDIVFLNRRGKGLSRIMVFYLVKDYAARAGIKRNVSPHTFRHSFATHLLEGGANLCAIQAMLGHESITTTEIYTHLESHFLRSEIIEHHPRNQLLF